ncbi:MAG TPA: hypothetical protein VMD05_07445 [Candidatus Nanoarchaeia archaeon]|nr:hypothetical protein [Candidatus Nanoarchaeia archaeon]
MGQQSADELNTTTFDIYLYLVKTKEPEGPRDIMRAINIASPGVVHRHLQKLTEWGWLQKDSYGRYTVRRKVGFSGYIWVGQRLVPTSTLFAASFIVLTASFIGILLFHLIEGSPIDTSFAILVIVTVIAASFLLAEALRPRKRLPKESLDS